MISENELRLGNKCFYGDKIININLGDLALLTENKDHKYKPIPLTEEMLVKCGLKKEKVSNYGGADKWQGMGAYSYNGEWLFRGNCKGLKLVGYFNTNYEYLHQLQNIMYFLYGKELEVNL